MDSDKAPDHKERGAKGGQSRAQKLTPEQRKEIARQAAEKRWGKSLPHATHAGNIIIAGREIACAVLENGERVLTEESFLTAIGRASKANTSSGQVFLDDALPPFLKAENLQGYISDTLKESATPILFVSQRGKSTYGFKATLLPEVCEVYLRLRDDKKAHPTQAQIIQACDLLMRGLARIGIIALVDEATGYQAERTKNELAQILEKYIVAELLPWTRMFSPDFFEQVYRMYGWDYKPGSAKRPSCIGHFINRYIYGHLPPGVLDELKRKNPVTDKGFRKHKHFQFLTEDTGHPHLDKQISMVTMLMKISENKDAFDEAFSKAFEKNYQQRLPLVVPVD